MTDLDRLRKTARVLDLLDRSFLARQRGDRAEFDRLARAAVELDVDAVSVIEGGIVIGEIPNPERDLQGWSDYVAVVRDTAAEAERQAATEGGE